MTESDCPVCGTKMVDEGLEGNWHRFHCPECDREVLRPVTGDHGGVSVEDLSNISSFTDSESSTDTP